MPVLAKQILDKSNWQQVPFLKLEVKIVALEALGKWFWKAFEILVLFKFQIQFPPPPPPAPEISMFLEITSD